MCIAVRQMKPRDQLFLVTKKLLFDGKTEDPIAKTSNFFPADCRYICSPNCCLTIGEQRMPLKFCCSEVQRLHAKPDKFEIVFWMEVDTQTKYMDNIPTYLGAYEKVMRDNPSLADDVMLRLMSGLFNNATSDNYFAGITLA